MLKKGQVVTVYEDPVTCKRPEGKAKLLFRWAINGDGSELWDVIFVDDKGAGAFNRIIYPEVSP